VPESTLSLAFDSVQGGVREVWVMTVGYSANNPTGHRFVNLGVREVTTEQPVSSNPSWFVFTHDPSSNSGLMDSLAFAGPDPDGGPSQINVAQAMVPRPSIDPPFVDPANTDFEALTGDTNENTAPAWSARGDFIAYQIRRPLRMDGQTSTSSTRPATTQRLMSI
jgi:hypothetical protein